MNQFLNNLRYKLSAFMQGRYGMDNYGRFLLTVWLVLLILRLFVKSSLLYWLELALFIYIYFRIFSRNIPKRYRENQQYLQMKGKVTGFFKDFSFSGTGKKIRDAAEQAKDYHIYKCPKCSQKIRIPRGKGHIMVKCPKCGFEFHKKS